MIARKRAEARAKGLRGKSLSRAARGEPFERADVEDNAYTDGALADLGVAALRELKQNKQPFFLAVGFLKPHLPFNSPSRYWDLYDPKSIKLADNPFPPKDAPKFALTSWGELRAYDGIPQKGDLTDEQARTLRHAYYASVSFTDANVGKLLRALDELQLSSNTIVVLWGDHGWKLGEHNGWCKHTNFENDAHAPLIIRAPGQKARGSETDALTEFVDIYPTLCELAGLSKPKHLEGDSMAQFLNDPQAKGPAAAFSQYPRGRVMGYSIRTDRYRCTLWKTRATHTIQARELYDHQHDPQENTNVAARPENRSVMNELSEQIRRQFGH